MKSNSTNPVKDLQTIREIMERSSRFLSLSGLSGILAGIWALVGVAIAWFLILQPHHLNYSQLISNPAESDIPEIRVYLILDAIWVLGFAVLGAVFFSLRRARMTSQQVWNHTTRRLLVHFLIPLATGGIFALILLFHDNLELIASALLIFYGLSLVHAGTYTFNEIRYLGLTELALGIFAGIFVNLGLIFWTIGFGLMHIIYGVVMYYRHEHRQPLNQSVN